MLHNDAKIRCIDFCELGSSHQLMSDFLHCEDVTVITVDGCIQITWVQAKTQLVIHLPRIGEKLTEIMMPYSNISFSPSQWVYGNWQSLLMWTMGCILSSSVMWYVPGSHPIPSKQLGNLQMISFFV